MGSASGAISARTTARISERFILKNLLEWRGKKHPGGGVEKCLLNCTKWAPGAYGLSPAEWTPIT